MARFCCLPCQSNQNDDGILSALNSLQLSSPSFSTSTPRQPVLKPKPLQDITAFIATENSFRTPPLSDDPYENALISLPPTYSLPSISVAAARRRSRRRSQKLLFKSEPISSPSSGSNIENESIHMNKIKIKKNRRSSANFSSKRRSSLLMAKQSIQRKSKRREQRIDAFARSRKLVDETAKKSLDFKTDATFVVSPTNLSENQSIQTNISTDEEVAEILAFYTEVEQYKQNSNETNSEQVDDDLSIIDGISQMHLSDNFAVLCNQKRNQHPYQLPNGIDENPFNISDSQLSSAAATVAEIPSSVTDSHISSCLSNDTQQLSSLTTSSVKPSFNTTHCSALSITNTTGTTTRSSHCTRTYWSLHKIPQLFQYKSIRSKITEDLENSSAAAIWENFKFLWNNMHFLIKLYVIGVSVGFLAIIIAFLYRNAINRFL